MIFADLEERPFRLIILSDSEGPLAVQRSFAIAQDDNSKSASFDPQYVLFEMLPPEASHQTSRPCPYGQGQRASGEVFIFVANVGPDG